MKRDNDPSSRTAATVRVDDQPELLHAVLRQQAAIADIGQLALAGSDLDHLLNITVARVAATLEVELCKVLELSADGKKFLLRAGVGWNDGLVGVASVDAGRRSQAGYTLLSEGPVVVDEMRTDKRFKGPPLLTDHGVVSGVSVTIHGSGQPFGVLGAHTRSQRNFSPHDVDFMRAVSNVLAQAIERQRAEIVLARRLSELDHLYENTPLGLCLVDSELRYLRVNRSLATMNGKSIAEHIGRSIADVVPDLAAQAAPVYRRVLESGKPILDVEMRGVTPADPDTQRDWLVSYYPIRMEDGSVLGIGGVVQEITQRKRTERALQQERDRAQTYLDIAGVILVVLDADGAVSLINRRGCEILGRSPEEIIGSNWFRRYIRRSDRDTLGKVFGQLMRGEVDPVERYQNVVVTAAGEERLIAWHNTILRDESGTITGTLSSGEDVTERTRAELAALAAKEQLIQQQREETDRVEAELTKVRDELVTKTRLAAIGQVSASIAHDLRNPLGAVRNATYLLRKWATRQVDHDKPEEYLSVIDEEVRTADRIITNLMSLVRANEVRKQPVDLGQLVREVARSTKEASNLRLQLSLEHDPFVVLADPDQLRQVIGNLVVNAVQAMPDGGDLIVSAAHEPDADVVTIRDTGPGLDQAVRDRAFEPLVTTKAKGTGLGLAICSQIVERHDGRIELTDTYGPGAAFRITLPR